MQLQEVYGTHVRDNSIRRRFAEFDLPPHKTRCITEHLTTVQIRTLDWTASSSDQNPIEVNASEAFILTSSLDIVYVTDVTNTYFKIL